MTEEQETSQTPTNPRGHPVARAGHDAPSFHGLLAYSVCCPDNTQAEKQRHEKEVKRSETLSLMREPFSPVPPEAGARLVCPL